jgi:hypothetical protein
VVVAVAAPHPQAAQDCKGATAATLTIRLRISEQAAVVVRVLMAATDQALSLVMVGLE